ncbi:MAG TPA: hypothetical protein VJH20_03350 [Candidatus Nanoarchaeia archaeon]|nr:hypothetical protein [Candidatus Nanoarchaeia archaeon]
MGQVETSGIEGIVGRELKGFFQRHPDLVAESREHREKLKIEHPELLAQYDEIHGSSDDVDSLIDRRFDFSVKVYRYDPESKIFIGEGNDFCGGSTITGIIDENMIRFDKNYFGGKPRDSRISRFHLIRYSGTLTIKNQSIAMSGTYVPIGNCEISNYRGIWALQSVRDSVIVI